MKRLCSLFALCLVLGTPAFADSKVEPPVPVRTVAPDYPEALKKDGVMGVVVVKCVVDAQGNVAEPEIEKSSNAGFDQAALDAIKKWKFKPARQDGNPVAKKVSIPVRFVAES